MKKIILFMVIVIVLLGGVYGISKLNRNKDDNSEAQTGANSTPAVDDSQKIQSDIILFYSTTCPHCKVVEDFLKENKVADKLKFENLEVSSKLNSQLMQEKQDPCKDLSEDDKGGVPFLYSSEKCLVGSDTIINHFKQKLGIS
jgi:glutaredoxin